MDVPIKTRQAYAEVDNFIELLKKEDRDKIPKSLRNFFKEEKDIRYQKKIDASIPIAEQNLKEETLAIIALLNLKYICEDEKEKERLKQVYSENEKKYQEKQKEKYNYEKLFKEQDRKKSETIKKDKQIVPYKKGNFLQKIIHKLKQLFNKN